VSSGRVFINLLRRFSLFLFVVVAAAADDDGGGVDVSLVSSCN